MSHCFTCGGKGFLDKVCPECGREPNQVSLNLDKKDTTDFVKKIDNPTDAQIDLIKESLAIGTGKDRKKPDIDTFDWWNPFDYFSVDDIYKAAIYIPITNNQLAAVTGAN